MRYAILLLVCAVRCAGAAAERCGFSAVPVACALARVLAVLPAFTELIVGAFRAVNREGVHDLIVVATISVTVDVSSPQT